MWEQPGFFESSKQQQQQEGELVPTCLGMPWAVIHLLTETTLLVANPEACRQAPPQARRQHAVDIAVLHGTCAQPAVGTHSSGWPGASVPADTADWKSSARPQKKGLCHALSWLDWSGLRQILWICDHLSGYIPLRYLSLALRQRGVWRNPAPEDANNILSYWNKKTESVRLKRSRHGTRHTVDIK